MERKILKKHELDADGGPVIIVGVADCCGFEHGGIFGVHTCHDLIDHLRRAELGPSHRKCTNDEAISYNKVTFREGTREALFLFDYMRPDITGELQRYFKVWERLRDMLEAGDVTGSLPWAEPSMFARALNRRAKADAFRLLRVDQEGGNSVFVGPIPAWPYKLDRVSELDLNLDLFHGNRTVFEAVATDERGNTHRLYFSDKRAYQENFAPCFATSRTQITLVTGSAEAQELFAHLSPCRDREGFEQFDRVWNQLIEGAVL